MNPLELDDEIAAARMYAPHVQSIALVLNDADQARSRAVSGFGGSYVGGALMQTGRKGITVEVRGKREGLVPFRRLDEIVRAGRSDRTLTGLWLSHEEHCWHTALIKSETGRIFDRPYEWTWKPAIHRAADWRSTQTGWCPSAYNAATEALDDLDRLVIGAWFAHAAQTLTTSSELTLFEVA